MIYTKFINTLLHPIIYAYLGVDLESRVNAFAVLERGQTKEQCKI